MSKLGITENKLGNYFFKPTRKSNLAIFMSLMLFLFTGNGYTEGITEAWYAETTDRYGHFALGKAHEYAAITAKTDSGEYLRFELPAGLVFEDLKPRIVNIGAGTEKQLLTIVSGLDGGARLMILRQDGSNLVPAAQSEPIGTEMRWMNPVAVADLDGDGQVEIAAVITPHIGGTLKIFRLDGKRLVEIAALGGFSNHVYGSAELGMSTVVAVAGRMMLVVPDATRRRLRLIAFADGRLVELGSHPLEEPLNAALKPLPDGRIEIVGLRQRAILDLKRYVN